MISVGKYPQVSIKEARATQREYADLLQQGINPSTYKRTQKVQQATEKTFKEVAEEWYANKYDEKNSRYNKLVYRRLELHAYPKIGQLPIKSIDAPMLFNFIEAIQTTGHVVTGKRVNGVCSMVFRYGVAKGYCQRDLTQDYRGMLRTAQTIHLPSLTDPSQVGEFLRDLKGYNGTMTLKTAMLISPYVFLRPAELAASKWEYIDFEKNHWLIPAEDMKMSRDHLIPFPTQVRELLMKLYPVTGHSDFIFMHERDVNKSMHRENVNKAMRRIEDGKYIGRIVSHGFRSMASTLLNENKFRPDIIEKQLAHQERDTVRNAYNHAEYLNERTQMLQWYADYLDVLSSKPK